jgi:hypothetical protein
MTRPSHGRGGRQRRRLRLWHCGASLAVVALAALPGGLSAWQAGPPPAVVIWTLEAPASVRPAQVFDATLKASVVAGWKFYAVEQVAEGPRPLLVTTGDPAFVLAGPVRPDAPPRSVTDTIWSAVVAYHDRTTKFRVPLRPSPAAGPRIIQLKVRFQACSDEVCLRPATITVTRPVLIE